MTPITWPQGVPDRPRREGAVGGPVDARAAFAPEVGVPITRPRTTARIERFEVPLQPITADEYDLFMAWFDGPAAQGAAEFVWRHPFTREVTRWKFVEQDPLIQVERASLRLFYLTFQAMRLPGVPWYGAYVPAGTLRLPAVVADYDAGVFGIGGDRVAASAVAAVVGTFDLWTWPTSGPVVIATSATVTAGDIPATAPVGVSKIVAYAP